MDDTLSNVRFRPKRKMDRLLILLFFVDFTISIVLCFWIAKAVAELKDLVDVGCQNQEILVITHPGTVHDVSPLCSRNDP